MTTFLNSMGVVRDGFLDLLFASIFVVCFTTFLFVAEINFTDDHKQQIDFIYINSTNSSKLATLNLTNLTEITSESDILDYVLQLKDGIEPDMEQINSYNHPVLLHNQSKCREKNGQMKKIKLLIMIKSAMKNRKNRHAIRQTWGSENRFPGIVIRRLFLLGIYPPDKKLQMTINDEQKRNGDLIQSAFVDTYFNNTIKTMTGFRWVVEKCPSAEFILFADDDMFVNIKNLLAFINRENKCGNRSKNCNFDFFAGRALNNSPPVRTKSGKWYVSYDEYPFPDYPPFVNAGAYVLSYNTLEKLYYGSAFTRHFRFDDVFLGLVARRCNISITHSNLFQFDKLTYVRKLYKNLIAVHGFHNSVRLLRIWRDQLFLRNT